jgi:hypothetical protein
MSSSSSKNIQPQYKFQQFLQPQDLFYKPQTSNKKNNYGGVDYITNLSTRRTSSRKDQQSSLSLSKELSQPHINSQSRNIPNTFRQVLTKKKKSTKNSKDYSRDIRSNSNMH